MFLFVCLFLFDLCVMSTNILLLLPLLSGLSTCIHVILPLCRATEASLCTSHDTKIFNTHSMTCRDEVENKMVLLKRDFSHGMDLSVVYEIVISVASCLYSENYGCTADARIDES